LKTLGLIGPRASRERDNTSQIRQIIVHVRCPCSKPPVSNIKPLVEPRNPAGVLTESNLFHTERELVWIVSLAGSVNLLGQSTAELVTEGACATTNNSQHSEHRASLCVRGKVRPLHQSTVSVVEMPT
jgi:hypothetical protein